MQRDTTLIAARCNDINGAECYLQKSNWSTSITVSSGQLVTNTCRYVLYGILFFNFSHFPEGVESQGRGHG